MYGDQRDVSVQLSANVDPFQKAMRAAGQTVQQLTDATVKLGKTVDDLVKKTGKGLTLFAAGQVTSALALAEAANRVDIQFRNIRATSSITGQNFAQLQRYAEKLSGTLPVSVGQVAQLMTTVQNLGVQGTHNLENFTQVAVKLGAATGESSEALISGLTDLMKTMGSSYTSVERYGSALVSLSKNNGVAASSILSFAQAIEPVASQLGMTQLQVMSLATAFNKVGAEGFTGANAFNKIFTDITLSIETGSPKLKQYADILGVTTDQLTAMVKTDPTRFFINFMYAIEKEGSAGIRTLDNLGLSGARTIRTFAALTSGRANLGSILNDANDSFSKNTSLAQASNAAWNDLGASMQRLREVISNIAVQMGSGIAPAVKGLVNVTTDLAQAFGDVVNVMQPILGTFSALAGLIGGIGGPLALITLELLKFSVIWRLVGGLPVFNFFRGFKDAVKGVDDRPVSQLGSKPMQMIYNVGRRTGGVLSGGGAKGGGGGFANLLGNIFYRNPVTGFPLRKLGYEIREMGDTIGSDSVLHPLRTSHILHPELRDQTKVSPYSGLGIYQMSRRFLVGDESQPNLYKRIRMTPEERIPTVDLRAASLANMAKAPTVTTMGAEAGGFLGKAVMAIAGLAGPALMAALAFQMLKDPVRNLIEGTNKASQNLEKLGGIAGQSSTNLGGQALTYSNLVKILTKPTGPADNPAPYSAGEFKRATSKDFRSQNSDSLTALGAAHTRASKVAMLQMAANGMILGNNNQPLSSDQVTQLRQLAIADSGVAGGQSLMQSINTQQYSSANYGAIAATGVSQSHDWHSQISGRYQGNARLDMESLAQGFIYAYLNGDKRTAAQILGQVQMAELASPGAAEVFNSYLTHQMGLKHVSIHNSSAAFLRSLQQGDATNQALFSFIQSTGVPQFTGHNGVNNPAFNGIGDPNKGFWQRYIAGAATLPISAQEQAQTAAANADTMAGRIAKQFDFASIQNNTVATGAAVAKLSQEMLKQAGSVDGAIAALNAYKNQLSTDTPEYAAAAAAVDRLKNSFENLKQTAFMSPGAQGLFLLNGIQSDLTNGLYSASGSSTDVTLNPTENQADAQGRIDQAKQLQLQQVQDLKSYLMEERSLQLQEKYATQDHYVQLSRMERDYTIQVKEARYQRNRQLLQQQHEYNEQVRSEQRDMAFNTFNPLHRVDAAYTAGAAEGLLTSNEQNRYMASAKANLAKLRAMGVSNDVIQALGLDDPKNFEQLSRFVSDLAANPKLVAQWNASIKNKLDISKGLTLDPSNSKMNEFKRNFDYMAKVAAEDFDHSMQVSAEAFQRTLSDFEADYKTASERLDAQMQLIGQNVFTSYDQIMSAALKSAVKNIRDYANTVETEGKRILWWQNQVNGHQVGGGGATGADGGGGGGRGGSGGRTGGASSPDLPGGSPGAAPRNPGGNVGLGKQMAAAYGWGTGAEWNALYWLWNQESGWSTTAGSPSRAYGIPQALPGSKMASVGRDWMYNPRTQIRWGLNYIRGTYGDPIQAVNHKHATDSNLGSHAPYAQPGGWYAAGSVFNSPRVIGVGEKGPEAVIPLNSRGAQFFAQALSRTDYRSINGMKHASVIVYSGSVSNHYDASTQVHGPITVQSSDPDKMARQLQSKARLTALRRPVAPRAGG